jgi:two-component system sensor histidine kinase UhpB
MTLAGLLVQEAVSLVPQDVAPDQALAKLPLQLRFLRHVRILVHDASGAPIADGGQAAPKGDERPGAPAWFAALIEPPIERLDVPVIVSDWAPWW